MISITENKKAVLYLRYSSNNQTEQSIEGQRRICQQYAEREGYQIIREYVDRATSASHDTQKRLSFQRMIKDAKSEEFQIVLVYKLDRFSRDRYDFANYRAKLKEHGVRVQSATEAISDSPESVIMESLLEGMAEYYSRELSQKVTRGMNESAEKRQVLGGVVPLGLLSENKKYVPDPETKHIVMQIYDDYRTGSTLKEIAEDLNRKGIRNRKGRPFKPMSVWRILTNEKYCGVYRHKDIVDPNAIEPIITKDVWDAVQIKLEENKKVMRKRPKADRPEFLLKGKAFCGHCGYALVPDSGTSKSGKVHYYYKCNGKKQLHICEKKNELKEQIEDLVINDAVNLLTDERIKEIANLAVAEYEKAESTAEVNYVESQIRSVDQKIDNLVDAIANGLMSEAVGTRLKAAEKEKADLEAYLDQLTRDRFVVTYEHVTYYLQKMRDALTEPDFAKRLIETFVERVELFDSDEKGGKGYIKISYNLTDMDGKRVQTSSRNPDHSLEQLNSDSLIISLPGLVLIHTFAFKRK